MSKKSGKGLSTTAGLLAAAGAATAAAAGYYFYASADAKTNRKLAAKWASNMKKDIVKEARNIIDVDKEKLLQVVDEISKAYDGLRGVSKTELHAVVKELKDNWENLKAESQSAVKKATAVSKKTARRASGAVKREGKIMKRKVVSTQKRIKAKS